MLTPQFGAASNSEGIMAHRAQFRRAVAVVLASAGIYFAAIVYAQPVPQSDDFVVGTSGPDYRRLQRTRAISRDSDGSFVAVWRANEDGRFGIFAQRYDSDGNPVGSEFRVSDEDETMTNLRSDVPAVAHAQNGEFVVVWRGKPASDPSSSGWYQIIGRRIGADGAKIGDEFTVSTTPPFASAYTKPDLTTMEDGSFVVVWQGRPDPSEYLSAVMGQRMADDATRVGGEFRVSTSEGSVYDPQVGTRGNGSFVVVWAVQGNYGLPDPDGNSLGVFGQRFASDGSKAGDEFQVNTFTQYAEHEPDVAVRSDGSFVVVWTTQYGDDDPGYGGVFDDSVTMRRFDSGGSPLGDEVHINTFATGVQGEPAIAMDNDGSFVVVWRSASGYGGEDPRDDGGGLFGRCFNANGVGPVDEFHVNSELSGFDRVPSIASDGFGDFVVAWERSTDGYSFYSDAYARRFKAQGCSGSNGTTTTTTTTMPTGDICGDPVALTISSTAGAAASGGFLDTGARVVTASDALFALQSAVGTVLCPVCVCDVNESGDVTATDSLIMLQAAVGVPISLTCPPCSS
jgi:hypothetical protein